MTTHERVTRILRHEEADRIPMTDIPWTATLERWHQEGLPKSVDWVDFFGLDHFCVIQADNSPRFPEKTLEEKEDYRVVTTRWGATIKQWKNRGGVPEFLDFSIRDRETWELAKARMTPDRDRIDWQTLSHSYPVWRKRGDWISAGFWFGFDVTHSWALGTEQVLMALVEDPDWLIDIFRHYLEVDLALFEMVWDAGYHFDAITWPDDMGYKGHQFFSLDTYRNILKPIHAQACAWAKRKGIKVALHSCGDIRPFLPDLIEIGVDILNPVEVKAGMDPLALKRRYGRQLTFHGGINAALFWEPEKLEAHIKAVIPGMKEGGGYIFSSDHSVPDSVSLRQFQQFVELARELGRYS